jgi:hypothetical protein
MSETKTKGSQDLPIGELLKKAWDIFSKNINVFIILILIAFGLELIPIIIGFFGGASFIAGIVGGAATMSTGGFSVLDTFATGMGLVILLVFALALVFVATWVMSAYTYAVYDAINGKMLTAWEYYKKGLKKFWVFLGLTIVMGLLVGIGFMLLIIPGIIVTIFLVYAYYLVPAEDANVGKALSRSFELAKKNWLLIAIMMAILSVAMFVLNFIPLVNFVVTIFAGLFYLIIVGLMYEKAK